MTLVQLQGVLHAAARVVIELRPCDHMTPTMRELHWLPLEQRIQFKLCLLVYKTLISHAPTYLSDCSHPPSTYQDNLLFER